MRKASGFTLIEVMIVVAVVAILSAIAYPSYQRYVMRAKRADAEQLMMQIDSRQKQILIEQRAFATAIGAIVTPQGWTCTGAGTVPGTCTNAAYSITFNPTVANSATPPSYTICATALGSQASDGYLALASTGTKVRATSGSCTAPGADLGW
jgi:type IV pilus assembly protein PilE